ncbi:hypothetical protein IE53DRAFT_162071 [Violaceomyces palustris]|uniref:Uncharacterized protein n=1 Tax=Violaceomyces palustris TaxID=1673888 RepID=A0ACD0NTE5_9BASI|nr:hypothetical protein IE53DRAFT_162071 [Violaceomyces palustris]
MFLEGMQMRWLGNAAWPPGLRETICDSWLWRWLKCENGMEDVATLLSVIAYRQAIPDSVWSKVEASVLTIRGDLLQPYPESQESMYQSKLVSARKFESLVIQGAPMVVTITHPEHVAFAVSRFLHAIQGSSTSVELGTPAVTEEACRNDKAPSFAEPGPIDRRVYERLMTQSGFAHLIPLRFANGESRRGQAVSQGGVADVDDVSSCCSSGSGITDPTGSGDAACPSNTSEAGSFRSDLARWTPTAAGVEDLNDGVEIAQSWSCQAWAEEASSDLAADDQAFGDGSRDRTSFGAMVCANPIRYNLDLPLTTRARQGTIYFELVVDRDQSSSPPLLEDETGGSHQDVPNDVLESLADVL